MNRKVMTLALAVLVSGSTVVVDAHAQSSGGSASGSPSGSGGAAKQGTAGGGTPSAAGGGGASAGGTSKTTGSAAGEKGAGGTGASTTGAGGPPAGKEAGGSGQPATAGPHASDAPKNRTRMPSGKRRPGKDGNMRSGTDVGFGEEETGSITKSRRQGREAEGGKSDPAPKAAPQQK